MSDFDFDEIDKAVTGALNSESSDPQSPSTTQPPVAPASTPMPVPSQALVADPVPEPSFMASEEPKVAPAARRSSGRFMDVMHPSSDMRTQSGPTAFMQPVSKPASNTPDPEPALTIEADLNNDDADATLNELDAAVGAWSKPLESPFLSDAKVEKRPLGGAAIDFSQSLLEAPEEELKLEAPEEEHLLQASFPDPIDFAAQTAAPSSVLEDTGSPAPVEKEPETSFIEAPQLSEDSPAKTPEVSVASEPVALAAPEAPVGPTSISQQYNEVPSTEQASGAIYDTENYHQPLAQSAKKHSGVWTIIWILLLVILGAGAGVAFYLFVLPML